MDTHMSSAGLSVEKSRFLNSMSRSLSRSYTGSLNKSFQQPGFLEAYYNFQYANNLSRNQMGSPSNLADMENKFCKDFNCCGLQLNDMHELLQHFEECHVVLDGGNNNGNNENGGDEDMQEDDEEDDLQFQFEVTNHDEDQMMMMDHDHLSSAAISAAAAAAAGDAMMMMMATNPTHNNMMKKNPAGSVALSDIYQQSDYPLGSAFDSNAIRKRSASQNTVNSSSTQMSHMGGTTQPWLQTMSDSPPKIFPVLLETSTALTREESTALRRKESPTIITTPVSVAALMPPSPVAVAVAATKREPRAATVEVSYTTPNTTSSGRMSYNTPSTTSSGRHKKEVVVADLGELERDDRPYKCKIADCNKAYKNPGGLKYHLHHGHCEDTGDPEMNDLIHKPYQCTVADCLKRYKNLNGLKYHIEHAHISLLSE